MKESYRLLPVYAGDVSGIASALYELGGMVVIHDPSGCNSTYNTHDELRWYETESNIFISGLNMRDAVLGNDRKFIADILEAADGISPAPAFIAICNSPVPFLNGTDFTGICRIIERESGIPTFYVLSNGMHDYVTGIRQAFLSYAKKMLPDQRRLTLAADDSINLLGLTPLSFSHRDTAYDLISLLKGCGFSVNAVWAMGEKTANIGKTGDAAVNLVLSETALPLAEYLKRIYGTPYVIGCPVSPDAADAVEEALKDAAAAGLSGEKIYADASPFFENFSPDGRMGKQRNPILPGQDADRFSPLKIAVYIGEAVLASSLAAFNREADKTLVLCPFEAGRALLAANGKYFCGEEGYLSALKEIFERYPKAQITVYADPMYGLLLPDTVRFVPEPVLAMSGRQYQGHYINYFDI